MGFLQYSLPYSFSSNVISALPKQRHDFIYDSLRLLSIINNSLHMLVRGRIRHRISSN